MPELLLGTFRDVCVLAADFVGAKVLAPSNQLPDFPGSGVVHH